MAGPTDAQIACGRETVETNIRPIDVGSCTAYRKGIPDPARLAVQEKYTDGTRLDQGWSDLTERIIVREVTLVEGSAEVTPFLAKGLVLFGDLKFGQF